MAVFFTKNGLSNDTRLSQLRVERARGRIRYWNRGRNEEVVLLRKERNVHYSIPAERGRQSGLIK